MDVLLALGVTKCKRAILIGSAGALDSRIGIGDIVIPECSVCGDGASRYIAADSLKSGDVFGDNVYPDEKLFATIRRNAQSVCKNANVNCHTGKTFSIDTVAAQFAHIDEIVKTGCSVVEMETAAAFRAARLADISLAAIFSVSDNTFANKSLVSGRNEEEQKYRRLTRKKIFPQVILKTFQEAQ